MGGLVGLVLDFFWPCKAHKGRHWGASADPPQPGRAGQLARL